MHTQTLMASLIAASCLLSACNSGSDKSAPETPPDSAVIPPPPPPPAAKPKNVIMFVGDGMGMTTLTAARIYAVGEEGQLTLDTLPESAYIKTYSNDAQVTDSAPSMSAYMTGVKMNNEVVAMSADTLAVPPKAGDSLCPADNGKPVETLLEIAKAAGLATGVVTTTRVTHATPASTYAHSCHRDAENTIAAALVPGGAGYNAKLGDGLNVIFGGGLGYFLPIEAKGKRSDKRDLTAELKAQGYGVVTDKAGFDALDSAKTDKAIALFTASHMSYELDRDPGKEPSLAEMSVKALGILQKNPKGYFLMIEGGRIDHALHETTAKKALHDAVAFDKALAEVLAEVKKTDPKLENTTLVVTADHDHTLVLNGYAKRTGKTTDTEAGVLGLVNDYAEKGKVPVLDADGMPYSIIGFGNGENRADGNRKTFAALTETATSANDYHQEAVIKTAAGSETHGGTDVYLGATGKGAEQFHGFMDNTEVFKALRAASGL